MLRAKLKNKNSKILAVLTLRSTQTTKTAVRKPGRSSTYKEHWTRYTFTFSVAVGIFFKNKVSFYQVNCKETVLRGKRERPSVVSFRFKLFECFAWSKLLREILSWKKKWTVVSFARYVSKRKKRVELEMHDVWPGRRMTHIESRRSSSVQ